MRKHELANGNGGGAVPTDVPPMQMGDNLTRDEFLRRWELHPEIKRAELIGGIVFMPSTHHDRFAKPVEGAPPLENGDNLTLEEFLHRWEQHPEIKFAELLGGIVYMPSPLSLEHGTTDNLVSTWLGTYQAFTPGTEASTNATTVMERQSPQPDAFLRIRPDYGGQSGTKNKLVFGGPEFISETCLTSSSYDLHQKLEIYERSHVREYLTVLMHEQEIRWHRLGKHGFSLVKPDASGIWKSKVFPGLWLDGTALLAHDSAKVLATLQLGMQTPEHAAFVKKLAKKKKK